MTTAITIKNQQLDVMTLGDVLTKSGYFSDTRQAAQAVVKVLAGQELGVGPIASMTGINIIKGRVTITANLMAGLVKSERNPYDYRISELTNEVCELEFFANGKALGPSRFTIEDARQAKLTAGDNWSKYPRNMLFARAISNGVKWYCPNITNGAPIYTPDELGAEIDGETGEVIEWQEPIIESPQPTNDDPSVWLPSLDEFKKQVSSDFKKTWEEIVIILKEECGMTGFTSSKATEMYNCLAVYIADQKTSNAKKAKDEPETVEDNFEDLFPGSSQE